MKKSILCLFTISVLLLLCYNHTHASNAITSQGIIVYTVKKGDTISSIARAFGVTQGHLLKDNMTIQHNTILPGQTLQITPESGVSVVVAKNMSINDVATQFSVTIADLLASNDIANTGVIIQSGTEIFIPRDQTTVVGILARPQIIITRSGGQRVDLSQISQQTAQAYLSTIFTQSFGITDIPQNRGTILASWFQRGIGTFGFVQGHCTDYVASRRPDIFQKGKGFRGNAKDWATNAQKAGYAVGSSPQRRAIAVFAPGKGGDPVYGHVAYVEQIDTKNNRLIISEMNYLGRNIVTKRVVDSRLPIAYIY